MARLGILGTLSSPLSAASDFPLYRTGPQSERFYGPAGDVDGDGKADVLLVSAGLFFSPASPQQAFVRSGLNGTLLQTWTPSLPAYSGFQGVSNVSPAGDLNLDGFGDVALSIFSPTSPQVIEVRSGVDGSVISIIPSPAISNAALIGIGIAGMGDADADGWPELLVSGSHLVSIPGCMSLGRGVYNLEASGFGVQYYQTSWQCAQEFGSKIGRLDDVDGDGSADFYVGAWRTDVGALTDAGWIGVFSGVTGSLISSTAGTAPSQNLGVSLAGLNDVTGDGIPEIAALRSIPTPSGILGFDVVVFTLPTFAAVYNVTAASIGAFGLAEVDKLGDSDGDGLDDFLVRWASPVGYEAVTAFSGPNGSAIGQVAQGYPGGVLHPFGGLGDVNGDGLGDFATTPWTQNMNLPPIAAQSLWSSWSWPLTDGAVRVYVSPNLRVVGTPTVGGTAQFGVVAPKHPGRAFQVAFAQDYAFPALGLGPFLLPLTPDALFWASLAAGIGGTLSAIGQGTVTVQIPNSPSLQGAWFNASGVVYDASGPLGIGCVLTHVGFQVP